MTNWHTISAKFTDEEKRVLEIIHTEYGLNPNQTLRKSLELFARMLVMIEYYVTADSKIIKKINKISKKSMKQMDFEIKTMLKTIPIGIQESEYKKFTGDSTKVSSQFEKIFAKKKRGRKPKTKKRGRPKDTGLD